MEQDNSTTPVKNPLEAEEIQPSSLSIEDIIEQSVGNKLNTTQIIQAILASIPPFFDSQQTYMSIFAHAQPTWHCTTTNSSLCIANKSNLCSIPKTQWGWDTREHTSVVSEFDLECTGSFISSLPSTLFFVGCLVGGLVFSTLGDSLLGRKKLLCISFLVMSTFAFASSFSPNLWVYSLFRFLSGLGRAPITICGLVLSTEKFGKKWRSQMIMYGFINFSIGILALTGIAYFNRDSSWRNLYLWTSIPGIVFSIICYIFLLESPRWLFMQGKHEESMAVLRKLGSMTANQALFSNTIVTNTNNSSPFSSLNILIKKKWAVKRLLASVIISFGIGLVYFGMFLGVGNLGFNIYLTSTISALLSLFTYLLTFLYWIPRCNRRSSLLGFCIISGTTTILFSIIGKNSHKGLVIGLELVSLFCTCMAYNLLLMYIVELFPTCVRNSASTLARQAMIFGSVFDPVLILLGKQKMVYCYGVFGTTVLLCGVLVVCLPETRGKALCDTMEEQEFSDNSSRIMM